MKAYKIILVALIPFVLGSFKNESTVIIKGKILGKFPAKVAYTLNNNNTYNWVKADSAKTDSLGNFRIKINSEKVAFIKLSASVEAQAMLIIEPKGRYEVQFDLNKNKDYFQVLKGNADAQNLYNKSTLPMDPELVQVDAQKLYRDTSTTSIREKIAKQKAADVAPFKKLFDEGKISKDYFQLLLIDRDCYYATLQATVVWIKQLTVSRSKKPLPDEMKNLWIETFQKPLFDVEKIGSTPWFYSYCQKYVYFKEFINNDTNPDNTNSQYTTYFINEARKYLPKHLLESFVANQIYLKCLDKQYENELVTQYTQFKKDYPKSNYTKYIKPEIDENIRFHQVAKTEFSNKIKFVDNYQNINTLKEAVEFAKGKKVYIDVWATWCHSCREEFVYRKELSKLLEAKGITMLYISVDRDEKDKQWKDLAKFYNLEGYHIRVNKNLYADLSRIYNWHGSISIPWYIIIDENGNILKEHAKSPAEIKELEKELSSN